MFDLNEAIAAWRGGLKNQPNFKTTDLDELEDHLREEIGGLCTTGLSEEEAFLIAARRIGRPEDLNTEFAIADPSRRRKFRLSWMILGALSLAFLWLAAEVVGNFAAGTAAHLSVGTGPFGPFGLAWFGGITRILILVVGGILIWRLLSRDTGARRVANMGVGTFFALALLLVVLALGTRVGSHTFFFSGLPFNGAAGGAMALTYLRTFILMILPLLLLLGLWKLITGRR